MAVQMGFTAVYCGLPECPCTTAGIDLAAELRDAVQRCRYGVLVRGNCLARLLAHQGYDLGGPCSARSAGADAFVLVQPCDAHRRAFGPAHVAGPLHESRDVQDLQKWLQRGLPSGKPLPAHLQPTFVSA